MQLREEASLERERKSVADSEAAAAGREALEKAEKTHNETASSRSAALDRQEADLKALDKALLEREMGLKSVRSELASERARLDEQVQQVRMQQHESLCSALVPVNGHCMLLVH